MKAIFNNQEKTSIETFKRWNSTVPSAAVLTLVSLTHIQGDESYLGRERITLKVRELAENEPFARYLFNFEAPIAYRLIESAYGRSELQRQSMILGSTMEIQNSEFYKSLRTADPIIITAGKNLRHFAVVTDRVNFEILTEFEPQFEALR